MQVELLTNNDLVSFKETILQEIKELFKSYSSPKEWLKTSEVKKLLKCSDGTLQKLRNNGKLPYKRILGTFYYDKKQIDSLFMQNSEHN